LQHESNQFSCYNKTTTGAVGGDADINSGPASRRNRRRRSNAKGSRERGRSRGSEALNFQWHIVKSGRIYHSLQVIH